MQRRAGLTIKMVRRMKHTYPRCIDIAEKVSQLLRVYVYGRRSFSR